jgi:putative ABC transport system substrate-binding protein
MNRAEQRRQKQLSRRRLLCGAAGAGFALAGPSLLAGCGGPSLPVRDEQRARVYRVGWLHDGDPVSESTPLSWPPPIPPTSARFLERLTELGYVEGRTLHWEWRRAPTADQLAAAAADLVERRVELILVAAAPRALRAAFEAPGNTPIVSCAGTSDPVGDGYAQSLARPGGKVTGVLYNSPLGVFRPKRIEVLKATLPSMSRLGVLFDVDHESGDTVETSRTAMGPIARELGIELIYEEVRALEEFGGACAALAHAGAQAVYPSTRANWTGVNAMERLSAEALRHGLPILGLNRLSARAGALVAYGPDPLAVWARAAEYVDKVLRGARPADLPFEHPTTYDLVINLTTARALGLTIPPDVIARATEVIQ